MEYKILEANGVENENIDGGAFNNFCAGGESGIVAEVLDECSITSVGSIVTVNTGLLNIKGIRVKITAPKDFTLQGTPAVDTIYRIVAKVVLSSGGNVSFDLYTTTLQTLIQDNLYKNNIGTYEIELATFTHSKGGGIKDLKRTARLLHGNEREDLNEKFNVLEQSLKDDIDAFKVETSKEIKIFKEESQSQINTNTNKISALESALVSAGTIDKRLSMMTEEIRQIGGTDLEGLTILDESLCTVNTIRGNTVATDTGLKNAQISGIKSSGRNLITLDYMVATDDGNEWTNALVKNPDGTFTISKNGTNRMSKKWACDIPAGTYTLSWKISDYKNATGSENNGSPIIAFLDENEKVITSPRLYLTSWEKSQNTLSKDVKYIYIYMQSDAADGDFVTIKEIMLYKGNENPLPPYMPYGVESTLQFPKTIELGKWDYITNGQLVRETIVEAYDGTKYDETNGTYNGTTDFVLSQDGTQVAYKRTATSTPIDFDNQYIVWNKGFEQVLTPEDENGLTCFDYGANTTEENEYMILLGGTN